MGRNEQIRTQLEQLRADGVVRSWYAYAPGDRKGRRWVVETTGISTRVFSTREVEAFLQGVRAQVFAPEATNAH